MDQLNLYLEQLIATSGHELHLRPNATPYVVSASGNTDLGNVPLQGSQISMMVFPLIPAEVKHDLPNKPSVQFVHPSNIGEFSFTIQKSAAGFNVTITPLSPGIPHEPPAAFAPSAETGPTTAEEDSFFNVSTDSFLPIDLQPLDAPVSTGTLNVPETSLFGGPDAQAKNMVTFADSTPTFGEISLEGLQSVEEYIPTLDDVPHLPAEQLVTNPVGDRRTSVRTASNSEMKDRMESLFRAMADASASDLHLSVGMPPMIRRDGRIRKLQCSEDVLAEEVMKALLYSIIPARNREEFASRQDSDFAYEIPGLARFRSNVFMDRKGMAAAFRIIPSMMIAAEQLGLSSAIMGLCDASKGLVVVTGPAGSGRSTTLGAMINHINSTREDHIITIEDPVEFIHENIRCLINQREVHNNTTSFKDALRAALREDPDVVMVGEMRDLETISLAIEIAESGRLVFGTLHTTTAVSTVDRMIGHFPADHQQQVRVMLSESLKGVVAQTLLPKKGGGRVAAHEVLIVTPAVSGLIREGKTLQIQAAMQAANAHGMVLLDDALYDLVHNGIVEQRDAYVKAVDKAGFEAILTKGGYTI